MLTLFVIISVLVFVSLVFVINFLAVPTWEQPKKDYYTINGIFLSKGLSNFYLKYAKHNYFNCIQWRILSVEVVLIPTFTEESIFYTISQLGSITITKIVVESEFDKWIKQTEIIDLCFQMESIGLSEDEIAQQLYLMFKSNSSIIV